MEVFTRKDDNSSTRIMKRILIDLTDLELWSGHFGGTQRVVYNISKQFYLNQENPNTTLDFISFSTNKKRYYYTDFKTIYERIENNKTTSITLNQIALKQRLKRKLIRVTPEYIYKNKRIKKIIIFLLRNLYTMLLKLKIKLKKLKISFNNPDSKKAVSFSSEDVVLILGKPWDDPNIQKILTQEKNQNNFMLVQVVYDLVVPLYPHLHHPSLFIPYTQNLFEAISISDILLPISEATAKDLKIFSKKLNLDLPKVHVIRLGDDIVNTDSNKLKLPKPDARIDNQFIACIGTIEIRKNHTLLYYIYKLSENKKIKLPQLVIVGSRGWLSGDIQYLIEHDPYIKNKIIIIDNADDNTLDWIYRNCLFTIYPSLYEGWGLPVAESLGYGKFCLASNSSSIPEIAGDLIEYFYPYDINNGLYKIIEYMDLKKLKTKSDIILKQYKTTSWKETLKQILNTIEK